jgi:hypothetical protein
MAIGAQTKWMLVARFDSIAERDLTASMGFGQMISMGLERLAASRCCRRSDRRPGPRISPGASASIRLKGHGKAVHARSRRLSAQSAPEARAAWVM